jgi:23S rRNA pseudouridine2605 synthase
MLDDKKTLPAKVEIVDYDRTRTCLEVTLTEGRNRQIRRIAEEFGFEVLKLHRRAIGEIKLNLPQDRLVSGQYRSLKPTEISFLKRHVKLEHQPQKVTFRTKR